MTVRLNTISNACDDLTVGNVYEVIGIEAGDYRIMNDLGQPYLYPAAAFDIVDPAEAADWQSSTGPDDERYAYAPALAKPGFFEDYFDGDRRAMATLQTYLLTTRRNSDPRRRVAG